MKTAFLARRNSSGFTLIELVISAALTGLILVSAYLCLSAGFSSQKIIEPRIEVLQGARVAMAMMAADLRAACDLSKDYQFLGMHRMLGEVEADNLDFATHNYSPSRPREGDFCQESFYLEKEPRSGQYILYRRRNPTIAPDPLSGGSKEEIARGLLGVRFEYYDGLDWYDSWGDVDRKGKKQKNSSLLAPNLSGLPEAVRMTLLFDSEPKSRASSALAATEAAEKATNGPPLVFQTVARLDLAAASRHAASSSSATSTQQAPDDSAQPGQPGQPLESEGIINRMRRRGSILVGLLWCLALLSVVVVGVLHTARLDLTVMKNYGDRTQAHYIALAGIEKTKALLYQDAADRRKSAKNHGSELYNDPKDFRDIAFGRGQFRVFRQGQPDEGGGIIYGLSDEESRLNINTASTNELSKLEGMTPDVVAAIMDWRDPDNEVTPGGAESEYYASLRPPYLTRNGPFQTTRELLMVRGVSRELLLGRDPAQDGLPEPADGKGPDGFPLVDETGDLESGWAGQMTVDSSVQDLNAGGQERVNVQNADESSLTAVHGITSDIAKAIVASRGQNQLKSLADLLDVVQARNNQGQNARGANRPPNAQQANNNSGPKVVSENLLMDIGDDVTIAQSGQDLPGMVNINTASLAVLTTLPGLDQQLARAIISYRKSSGFFPNIAWLLKVPGLNRDIFKQVAPRVTARSETYRILCEGKIKSTGVRQRIQVIVHVGLRDIDTLSYREDL